MATSFVGKPCMLKCHINQPTSCSLDARLLMGRLEGRQIDPDEQLSGQINDSTFRLFEGTESGLQACSFFFVKRQTSNVRMEQPTI
jgi:hypothetical protein